MLRRNCRRLRRGRLLMSTSRILEVASVRQVVTESGGTGERRDSLPYWPVIFLRLFGRATSLSPPRSGRTASPSRRDQFHLRRPRDAALLFIYRTFLRHEGRASTLGLFWFVMSASGLVVDRLFHLASLVPSSHHTRFAAALRARLDPGAQHRRDRRAGDALVLGAQQSSFDVSRHRSHRGMAVNTSAPGATRHLEHVDYYFCSPRCAERFDQRQRTGVIDDVAGDAMIRTEYGATLGGSRPNGAPRNGVAYYFSSEGGRCVPLGSEFSDAGHHTVRTSRYS